MDGTKTKVGGYPKAFTETQPANVCRTNELGVSLRQSSTPFCLPVSPLAQNVDHSPPPSPSLSCTEDVWSPRAASRSSSNPPLDPSTSPLRFSHSEEKSKSSLNNTCNIYNGYSRLEVGTRLFPRSHSTYQSTPRSLLKKYLLDTASNENNKFPIKYARTVGISNATYPFTTTFSNHPFPISPLVSKSMGFNKEPCQKKERPISSNFQRWCNTTLINNPYAANTDVNFIPGNNGILTSEPIFSSPASTKHNKMCQKYFESPSLLSVLQNNFHFPKTPNFPSAEFSNPQFSVDVPKVVSTPTFSSNTNFQYPPIPDNCLHTFISPTTTEQGYHDTYSDSIWLGGCDDAYRSRYPSGQCFRKNGNKRKRITKKITQPEKTSSPTIKSKGREGVEDSGLDGRKACNRLGASSESNSSCSTCCRILNCSPTKESLRISPSRGYDKENTSLCISKEASSRNNTQTERNSQRLKKEENNLSHYFENRYTFPEPYIAKSYSNGGDIDRRNRVIDGNNVNNSNFIFPTSYYYQSPLIGTYRCDHIRFDDEPSNHNPIICDKYPCTSPQNTISISQMSSLLDSKHVPVTSLVSLNMEKNNKRRFMQDHYSSTNLASVSPLSQLNVKSEKMKQVVPSSPIQPPILKLPPLLILKSPTTNFHSPNSLSPALSDHLLPLVSNEPNKQAIDSTAVSLTPHIVPKLSHSTECSDTVGDVGGSSSSGLEVNYSNKCVDDFISLSSPNLSLSSLVPSTLCSLSSSSLSLSSQQPAASRNGTNIPHADALKLVSEETYPTTLPLSESDVQDPIISHPTEQSISIPLYELSSTSCPRVISSVTGHESPVDRLSFHSFSPLLSESQGDKRQVIHSENDWEKNENRLSNADESSQNYQAAKLRPQKVGDERDTWCMQGDESVSTADKNGNLFKTRRLNDRDIKLAKEIALERIKTLEMDCFDLAMYCDGMKKVIWELLKQNRTKNLVVERAKDENNALRGKLIETVRDGALICQRNSDLVDRESQVRPHISALYLCGSFS